MSVGVYMPSYNVEKYICESVFSIIGQTFEDWELLNNLGKDINE